MPQVAVKISEPIFAKLKRLAHQQQTNYATIVEAALSAYEPATSEYASHGASEIHGDLQALIESALQPVLERLAMLESLGLVKQQHPSGLTVQISPQNAPESAVAALSVESAPVYQPNMEAAEIGSCAVTEPLPEEGIVEAAETVDGGMVESLEETDRMEKEAVLTPLPILPKPIDQPLPPIESAIKELGRQGHGQQAIANELNRRGYRTANGTLIRRGWVGNKLKGLGL